MAESSPRTQTPQENRRPLPGAHRGRGLAALQLGPVDPARGIGGEHQVEVVEVVLRFQAPLPVGEVAGANVAPSAGAAPGRGGLGGRAKLAERGVLVISGGADADELAGAGAGSVSQDSVQVGGLVAVQLVDQGEGRVAGRRRFRVARQDSDPAVSLQVPDLALVDSEPRTSGRGSGGRIRRPGAAGSRPGLDCGDDHHLGKVDGEQKCQIASAARRRTCPCFFASGPRSRSPGSGPRMSSSDVDAGTVRE